MSNVSRRLFLAALALGAVSGCSHSGTSPATHTLGGSGAKTTDENGLPLPVVTVNGTPITRTDMYSYLEQNYGAQYKASAVQRLLVDQEAHQQAVAPTDAEIQEDFDAKREMDWSYAQKLTRAPWLADDAKAESSC